MMLKCTIPKFWLNFFVSSEWKKVYDILSLGQFAITFARLNEIWEIPYLSVSLKYIDLFHFFVKPVRQLHFYLTPA
jgi:hypothetical protein